jgi:hypothetical protein
MIEQSFINFLHKNKCDLLVDENHENTYTIVCGGRSGLTDDLLNKIKKVKNKYPKYKFLSNCSSNAFTYFNDIKYSFDGLIDPLKRTKKSINLSMTFIHSIKSIESTTKFSKKQKTFDFFLYIGKLNRPDSKGINITRNLIPFLCKNGFTGILVSDDYGNDKKIFKKLINEKKLKLSRNINQEDFFDLLSQAKVSIFPNKEDAFPKLIIESLLCNNYCIINKKLFMGIEYLKKLDSCFFSNFSNKSISIRLKNAVNLKNESTPRDNYNKIYSSLEISKIWAKLINKKFNTNYTNLYHYKYLNHYT